MLPSRRQTHLYCSLSCGCLQAVTMQIQPGAHSRSAATQQAKPWLSQLHAPHPVPPDPPPGAQATAHCSKSYAKHTEALEFSVQTVSPVLHTVIKYKGAMVLNLGFHQACSASSCGNTGKNHCVFPPLGSPWLWGAHELGLVSALGIL